MIGIFPLLRDRKKITATLLEGKFHSSIDDFSLQRELWLSAAEKSSKSERLFSSTTVAFISLRSLSLGSIGMMIWKIRLKQDGRAFFYLLKVLIRLAHDTRTIDQPQYLELQAILQEIGKMVGGWIKFVPH